MPHLQREIEEIKVDWNQHKIRLQKKTDRPNGVPNNLYDFPEEKGGTQMGKRYSEKDYGFLMNKFDFEDELNYLPHSFKQQAQEEEAASSAQRLGYRRMWERLRRKNIRVKRDQVAACMKLLGLEKEMPYNKRHKKQHHFYTSKGPNYLWHIDGFDKLNRWGFYIHGAIDGYSRKILWLRVFVTNKDPWLVGKFFMEYVKESSVCPCRTRTDPGTENPILAKCQMFLRRATRMSCMDQIAITQVHQRLISLSKHSGAFFEKVDHNFG